MHFSIERTSDNILWLGTRNGKLIKYESGNFQYFQFDTIFNVSVFKDNYENIFAVNFSEIYDSLGIDGKKYLEIYKYENKKFTRLYSKYFEHIDNNTLTTNIVGGEIYARNSFNILKFNGTNFVKIIDTPEFAPSILFSGASSSDILTAGIFIQNHHNTNLFHWNGNKWSNELNIYINGPFNLSENVKGKYIFVGTDDPSETYLIVGSPKIK